MAPLTNVVRISRVSAATVRLLHAPSSVASAKPPGSRTTQGESKEGDELKLAFPRVYGARAYMQQHRTFSTSSPRPEDKKPTPHTADSYFKDVDRAPPPSEKTYEVDSSNPSVQRPNEQMSGEYSRAGPKPKGYATVEDGTYDVPPSKGPEKDQKLRYGGSQRYYDEQGPGSKVSKPEEGPSGASAGGRKPEG